MSTTLSAGLADASPAAPALSGEEFFRIEGAYSGLGAPIAGGRVAQWILTDGVLLDGAAEFFDELCWRLLGDGVPVWRATLHAGTLHPQIRGLGLRWWRDRRIIEEYRILHGAEATDEYRLSPIRAVIEKGVRVRRRLDGGAPPEYPLLAKIRSAGGTDYVALPLNRQNRHFPTVTWATDRPGGFSEADLAAFDELNPALAASIDTRAMRRISANLLDTYLGPQAGRRILAGQILRAEGDQLRAVIMASDLRNFTGLSDRLPANDVIRLLDDYFDAIVSAVQERRGEILKFIGDGVLAIFPAEEEDFSAASLRALEAAQGGLARLEAVNERRRQRDEAEIRAGIGLHLGEVIYGNVGSADRLDFTVVGPAVNLASRIEGLTKRLLRPLLTSSAFAQVCPRPLVSLGFQPVRGLHVPEEVFGLPE